MTYNLNERAQQLFRDSEYLQERWLSAIQWLRTQSKKGWLLDSSGASLKEMAR